MDDKTLKNDFMIVSALAILLMYSGSSYSAFKCKDAEGRISYQATSCTGGASQSEIGAPQRSPEYRASGKSSDTTLEELTTYPNEEFAQSLFDLRLLVATKLPAPTQEDANSCVEKFRTIFKDPQSVYAVDYAAFEDGGKPYIVVDVSARNGFGGATRRKIACAKN